MAENAPVAVVIPVYNRPRKLVNTLVSVVAQSKPPSFLVVVDDGSTDGTGEVAESWLASNANFEWKLIRQPNAGVAAARNAGFAEIGELPFVCFLDSDDLWPASFLAEGLLALEGCDAAIAAFADRMQEWPGLQRVDDFRHLVPNPTLWLICNDGGILSCALIRTKAAQAAGLFVPGMIASEDSDFLYRLFSLGGAVRSDAPPVRQIKWAPRLDRTEPPNLSSLSPELPYLWARHLEATVLKLPKGLLKKHRSLVRTAVSRRWAKSALACRQTNLMGRACVSLVRALWWDQSWRRRRQLVRSFCEGDEKILTAFETRLPHVTEN